MYEAIQKARNSSNWELVANIARFSQVQGLRGIISIKPQAFDGYAGKPWTQCNQERRHIDSSKAYGTKRLDKPQQPKRRHERVNRVWPNRKDKAGRALRLQSLCYHTLPIKLRHEQAGRVIGELQKNRLHGGKYSACITSNGGQSGQMETAKKINFRCPIAGRSIGTLSHQGTNSDSENAELGHFVPQRYKNTTFAILDCPPTGHLYRLTIYTSNLWGAV
ncbi:hypothetical protein [Methylophilus sp. OH31]|uniref:hypothetical protein n=1 Tax=Methylophilus sp. OH31 TaxID=1387312 RepID=UPI00191C02A5|nr:hypothetical protein [Methylophilus sp. OH31]